ncbi:hypothetical protein [uncultured Roseibium sp.]|uniref:hypothetical protein n=1 Tax=uncultured Roseibium sp. TaxID=1936171 RepID=UPI00260548B6|nr:hypothetical protein [uncultured Roseibium sp.]
MEMSTTTCNSGENPGGELMIPGLFDQIRKIDSKISSDKFEKSLSDRIAATREEFGGPENISVEDAIQLFQSVLLRAYKDAICLDMLICNDEDGEDEAVTQTRALNWFIKKSPDFDNVCRLSGYDPKKIYDFAVAEFENRGIIYKTTKGNYRIDTEELGKPHRRETIEVELVH